MNKISSSFLCLPLSHSLNLPCFSRREMNKRKNKHEISVQDLFFFTSVHVLVTLPLKSNAEEAVKNQCCLHNEFVPPWWCSRDSVSELARTRVRMKKKNRCVKVHVCRQGLTLCAWILTMRFDLFYRLSKFVSWHVLSWIAFANINIPPWVAYDSFLSLSLFLTAYRWWMPKLTQ